MKRVGVYLLQESSTQKGPKMTRLSLVALASLALCSCVPNYSITRTGTASLVAKQPGCDFSIVTTKAERPYEEIGIVDFVTGFITGPSARDASTFKEAIRGKVCELGGDAVFAEVNGYGQYIRGTVLRWKEIPAESTK